MRLIKSAKPVLLSIFMLSSLQVVVMGVCVKDASAAAQITVERGAPPRNLTPAPAQQNLPPEKKKSLSKFGPEDVFPGAQDQETKDRQRSRSGRRSSASIKPSPTLQATPQPTPAATPEIKPTPSPTPSPTIQEPAPRPTSTAVVAGVALTQPSGPGPQSSPPGWLLPSLALFSLMVLSAFIYVLIRLFEKLRKGSS